MPVKSCSWSWELRSGITDVGVTNLQSIADLSLVARGVNEHVWKALRLQLKFPHKANRMIVTLQLVDIQLPKTGELSGGKPKTNSKTIL